METKDTLEAVIIVTLIAFIFVAFILGKPVSYQKTEEVIGETFVRNADFYNLITSDCFSAEDSKKFTEKFLLDKKKIEDEYNREREFKNIRDISCFELRGPKEHGGPKLLYKLTIKYLDGKKDEFVFSNYNVGLYRIQAEQTFVNFVGIVDKENELVYPAIAKMEFELFIPLKEEEDIYE